MWCLGPKTNFLRKMDYSSCYLKRLVYGNVSHYLEEIEAIEGGMKRHTHKWTVYVRPFKKEDMSTYVKKIVFVLHESCENPRRTVKFPPYEVTETGWGEFDVRIEIYLEGPVEGPVVLKHGLVLTSVTDGIVERNVSESYAEVLFRNRSDEMSQRLSARPIVFGSWGYQSSKIEKIEKWVVGDVVKKERR